MLSYMLPVEEKPSETTTTTPPTTTAMTVSPPSLQVDAVGAIHQGLQVQKTPVSIVKGSTAPTSQRQLQQQLQQQQYPSQTMMNVGGRNLNLNLNLSNKLNQSGNTLLSAIIEKNTTTSTSSAASQMMNNSNSSIASDDNDDDGCHSFDNCDENTKLLDASEKICANGKTLACVTAAVASAANAADTSAICLHGSNHNGSNNKTAIRSCNSNGNNNNNSSISSSLKGGGNSSSCHDCIEEEEIGDTCDEDTETGGTTSDGDRRKQLKKVKLSKIGATKSVTLKRVSFGSSKGSMVETLVFETPTPLPEHAEREFGFSIENSINTGAHSICNNNINSACSRINSSLDDSGIELQEELERSKVRVSIYQSNQPQQVSPPESYSHFKDNSYLLISDTFSTEPSDFENDIMTAVTATPTSYDRQQSTDSGWDNPFRPGGDLSREADEIVNMIKGGKPITPTSDINHAISNGSAQKESHSIENGTAVVDGATKIQVAQSQSAAQNGTHSPQLRPATTTTTATSASPANGVSDTNGSTTQTQVSNKVVPGPTSASHVVIDDKKNKKKGCCVIQ
ncbi:putative uncharacterized protein DDB_G0274535 [Eupeodes corollae]|uniref:putative uncharacterized protein DDB_G0274535 n=1 Tax=Eupeodes corollae TaxID=290404 RepID=UPI002491935F|nr:putative uncharacterized protein DDB_G0274535 [Eupeodes corollae]